MKLNFEFKKDVLRIKFGSKIEFNIVNDLSIILDQIKDKRVDIIILNLETTEYLSVPGALYLISFCNFLKNNSNEYLITKLVIRSDNVIQFLNWLNFYSIMVTYANLDISNYGGVKSSYDNAYLKTENIKSLLFPIKIIPLIPESKFFESFASDFLNKFRIYFRQLGAVKQFNYFDDEIDFQDLFSAQYEIIKNIYDHSGTEGFGSIFASLNQKGTIIAYFDNGIGIVNSVLRCGKIKKPKRDEDTIHWALMDGNSSKDGKNQGTGFTIIKEFVNRKKGLLTIRTGNYLMIYKNKYWNSKRKNFFPGTQIVIYTPTI